MSVQVIKKDGNPEWAVLPYSEYERLVEAAESLLDIQDYDEARWALENGQDEFVPSAVANRILAGENLIQVWREFRRLTQAQLAKEADISAAYLSQLEAGKRTGGTDALSRIAHALNITIDDLI